MILYLSFEELSALRTGTERALDADAHAGHGIAAPPQVIADLEQLGPQLVGDITISSLDQQRRTRTAIAHLLVQSRREMDQAVLDQHPAAEPAVAAYFEYGNLLMVLDKLDRMQNEMLALLRVITGDDPDSEAARRFTFPD